jgi:hypothetical protein
MRDALPGKRIRRLENTLRFTDTFNNRAMLADAYLAYVIKQLVRAYFERQRYAEVIAMARRLYGRPQFARSKEHVLYARALVYMGDMAAAEQEFMKMKALFADFEARYQYGLFLRGSGREKEARLVFEDITGEASHLSSRERRDNRSWIVKAREELKKG